MTNVKEVGEIFKIFFKENIDDILGRRYF